MRLSLLTLSTTLALVGTACSHTEKKADAPEATKAQVSETTTKEKSKSESRESKVNKKTEDGEAASERSECAHGADKRVLETRAKDKGCELAYTKGGKESIVATSANGRVYCQKAYDKLKDKLQAAGYECK